MKRAKKTSFTHWFDKELSKDRAFRQKVEEAMNEMEIEQGLIALRESRGLSQRELADVLGVSQPVIARIESGKLKNVELRTLVRTIVALGGRLKIHIEHKQHKHDQNTRDVKRVHV